MIPPPATDRPRRPSAMPRSPVRTHPRRARGQRRRRRHARRSRRSRQRADRRVPSPHRCGRLSIDKSSPTSTENGVHRTHPRRARGQRRRRRHARRSRRSRQRADRRVPSPHRCGPPQHRRSHRRHRLRTAFIERIRSSPVGAWSARGLACDCEGPPWANSARASALERGCGLACGCDVLDGDVSPAGAMALHCWWFERPARSMFRPLGRRMRGADLTARLRDAGGVGGSDLRGPWNAEVGSGSVSIGPPAQLAAIAAAVDRRVIELVDAEQRRWVAIDPELEGPFECIRTMVAAGGKRLRPAFCYWGFIGFGGDRDDPRIVDVGAAFELMHAFALFHDDVMDDAGTRRGAPTAHATYGKLHAARAGPASRGGSARASRSSSVTSPSCCPTSCSSVCRRRCGGCGTSCAPNQHRPVPRHPRFGTTRAPRRRPSRSPGSRVAATASSARCAWARSPTPASTILLVVVPRRAERFRPAAR